jgi:hypothetical protein
MQLQVEHRTVDFDSADDFTHSESPVAAPSPEDTVVDSEHPGELDLPR